MNRNEFKPQPRYLLALKDEKRDENTPTLLKSKEFYSIMPMFLQKYPDAYIRDFLDTDGTFAIAFPSTKSFSLLDALNVYTDVVDTLEYTTYTHHKNTGFIEIAGEKDSDVPPLTGFWVLIK